MADYLKTEQIDGRTQCTLNADEMLIYIPDDYFLGSYAQLQSILCETFGIFYYKVNGQLHFFNLPNKIEFQYVDQPERVSLVLKSGMPSIKYRVFKLVRGCAFIWDLHREQKTDDLLFFVSNILENGKWPKIIAYDDMINTVYKLYEACNASVFTLGVTSVIIEMLIAQAVHYKNSPDKPMRLFYNVKNKYDYIPLRLTRVTSALSTMNALMGEDMAKQMISSVLRTREGRDEPPSELEKVMKY